MDPKFYKERKASKITEALCETSDLTLVVLSRSNVRLTYSVPDAA